MALYGGTYRAYGLLVRSALALPELEPGEGAPEVEIRLGHPVPPESAQKSASVRATARRIRLGWAGVGTFTVRDGRDMVVCPARGADERAVRLYLLGPALAALLHQRGLLTLHASGVAVDGAAIAFLGASGWGKSTIAAALLAQGHALVADDVMAVDFSGIRPTVRPGFPQLKLWPDAAVALGELPGNLPRLRSDLEKRARRLERDFAPLALPLRVIYVLGEHGRSEVTRLRPADAIIELVRHTYGVRALAPVQPAERFRQYGRLATEVAVRRLRVVRSLAALSELAHLVAEDATHAA